MLSHSLSVYKHELEPYYHGDETTLVQGEFRFVPGCDFHLCSNVSTQSIA